MEPTLTLLSSTFSPSPSVDRGTDPTTTLLVERLPVEGMRIEHAKRAPTEAARHEHVFVRRAYPEDYAGDCSCGEAARFFDGKWDVSPSYRKHGAPDLAHNTRGGSHG